MKMCDDGEFQLQQHRHISELPRVSCSSSVQWASPNPILPLPPPFQFSGLSPIFLRELRASSPLPISPHTHTHRHARACKNSILLSHLIYLPFSSGNYIHWISLFPNYSMQENVIFLENQCCIFCCYFFLFLSPLPPFSLPFSLLFSSLP